jgi:hypothetical protein
VTPSDREARRWPLTAAQIRDWCLGEGEARKNRQAGQPGSGEGTHDAGRDAGRRMGDEMTWPEAFFGAVACAAAAWFFVSVIRAGAGR